VKKWVFNACIAVPFGAVLAATDLGFTDFRYWALLILFAIYGSFYPKDKLCEAAPEMRDALRCLVGNADDGMLFSKRIEKAQAALAKAEAA
jgi:hypothetical protein